MSLRIKLILVTTAVVTVLFGISEWVSYEQTTALLEQHEAILEGTADHKIALGQLRATREQMFANAMTMRIIHAAGTLIVAVAILNYVWYRVIYRPIHRLLSRINAMGRGTWSGALPVKRNDEIGQLTTAFNDLGQQLTSTFHYINSSCRLSTLALLGGRMTREVTSVRGQIEVVARTLVSCSESEIGVATLTLLSAAGQLKSLETQLGNEFDRQFLAVSIDRSAIVDKNNETAVVVARA